MYCPLKFNRDLDKGLENSNCEKEGCALWIDRPEIVEKARTGIRVDQKEFKGCAIKLIAISKK